MSDSNCFYFRHSYGTWCQLCGGEHEEVKCYFLNYRPHYMDPRSSHNLKRGESKNKHYFSLECAQPDILGEMFLSELFQLEELILKWIEELGKDFINPPQDDTHEEMLEPHSDNLVAPENTFVPSKDLDDSRPCVDCAVKDSPSTSFGAYIDLSDSAYTFFNKSPEKGWTCPPRMKIGITLTDNLLRSRLSLGQLRYIRHFGVVPTSQEPPDTNKFLKKTRQLHKTVPRHGAVPSQHAPVSIERFHSDQYVRIRTNCVRTPPAHGAVSAEHGAVSRMLSFSINAAKNSAHLDQLGAEICRNLLSNYPR